MPKKCAICHKGTEGVPTFIVTLKRKENWEFVVPIPLFVGDRICQTHFPKSFLIKENNNNNFIKFHKTFVHYIYY